MRVRKILPPLLIIVGLILGWREAQSSFQILAWIFVAAGLIAGILERLLTPQSSMLPPAGRAPIGRSVTYSTPDEWSQNVATLIVDALRDAKLVSPSEFSRAAEIVGEEIAVRLDIGDYPGWAPAQSDGRDAGA